MGNPTKVRELLKQESSINFWRKHICDFYHGPSCCFDCNRTFCTDCKEVENERNPPDPLGQTVS